jgi:dTDP-4-dehydrorhamnose reductase
MVLKVFLTGGSGTLGKELRSQSEAFKVEFIAPSSKECDVRDYESVLKNIQSFDGDTVLHAAALTDTKEIEDDASGAIEVNVVGTLNVLKACKKLNKKMIYISTDYVFDGEKGNYEPTDPINPIGKYSKTKAAAELIVRTYENSLVIRTSFFGRTFPYQKAFVDVWSSKDYVDIIAPKIIYEIKKRTYGVSHVGSERRSLYEIARVRKGNVVKENNDNSLDIPRDTSFYIKKEKA